MEARESVPSPSPMSAWVIVISPCIAGSSVSNSTTWTTSVSGTSLTNRPWNGSVRSLVLSAAFGSS